MEYRIDKNNKTYYYEVNYDKSKLIEIIKKLKELKYQKEEKIIGGGRNTTIFDTAEKLRKESRDRSIRFFERYAKYIGDYKVLDEKEKFKLTKEGFNKYFNHEVVFLVTRYTDLYYTVDDILKEGLKLEMLNDIIKYNESKEFKELEINKDFNYKRLLELYTKVLQCLQFKLTAVKENVENEVIEDGVSLKRK